MFRKFLRSSIAPALIAMVFVLNANPASGQTDTLRWKLKEGQKFNVVANNDSTTTIDTPMGEQVIPTKMIMTMSWVVDSAKDGNYTVTQTIDRLQVDMTIPGLGEVTFDSDDEDADDGGAVGMMTAQFSKMVGTETKLKFDERGRVTKSEEKKPEGQANPLGGLNNTDMTSLAFFELPEGELSKGKTWSQKIDNKSPVGSMKMDNKYEFVEVDGNGHKINVKGDITFEAGEDAEATISIDEGTIKGTIWFDNQKGHMTKASLKQKIEMEVDAGFQKMSMSTEGETKFTIKLAK